MKNPQSQKTNRHISFYIANSAKWGRKPPLLFSMPKGKRIKVALASVGCKTNQYETAWLASELKEEGIKIVRSNESADVCIVFTCAVTHKAEVDSRKLLRKFRKRNPDALIVATGCGVQLNPHDYLSESMADICVGMNERKKLKNLITTGQLETKSTFINEKEDISFSPFGIKNIDAITLSRAWLKIQEGCSASCSYCIVPRLRGAPRSIASELIIDEAIRLSERFKEIVLVGTNIGLYGADLSPRKTLTELVEKILRLAEQRNFRVRLSSIEPMEFDKRLVELAKTSPLCPHFHIPLQGLSDKLLKQMNRPYTTSEVARLIEDIKSVLPNASVGTDIICGFVTESEQDFADGATFLNSLPISYLHIFSYSPRPNTPAIKLGSPPPIEQVKRRIAELKKIDAKKRELFLQSQIGKELEILITESQANNSKGLSENYLNAKIRENFKTGSLVKIFAQASDGHYILGKTSK